jgi:single-stranded DNA-binding protein
VRGANNVILIGNARPDAELWHTQSGKPVCNIRLGTNRTGKDGEVSQFHCCAGLTETTATDVKKGAPL